MMVLCSSWIQKLGTRNNIYCQVDQIVYRITQSLLFPLFIFYACFVSLKQRISFSFHLICFARGVLLCVSNILDFAVCLDAWTLCGNLFCTMFNIYVWLKLYMMILLLPVSSPRMIWWFTLFKISQYRLFIDRCRDSWNFSC